MSYIGVYHVPGLHVFDAYLSFIIFKLIKMVLIPQFRTISVFRILARLASEPAESGTSELENFLMKIGTVEYCWKNMIGKSKIQYILAYFGG